MTNTSTKSKNSATIGFETTLWQAANKLRSSMDAAEYKHVVQGLIFLKYISDTFASYRAQLEAGLGELITIKQPSTPMQYNVIQTAQQ